MRDKQIPGDTYNHKEHVYADPVALLQEIERDREEAKRKKKAEEEAKLRAAAPPPPVPSGPRKGTSGSTMYAELEKKTNLPSVRVRDLGSRFGGTVYRPSRPGQSEEDDPAPPPVPAVTDTRNILDTDSPPVSPSEVIRNKDLPSNASPQSVPAPNNDMNIPTEDGNVQRHISNANIPKDKALAPNNIEDKITEQPGSSSNVCVNKSGVVIDVTINSKTGFDIGAEIPGPREDEDENCGIKLMKNIPRDAFTTEESSETVHAASEKPVPSPDTSSAVSKAEQGSVAGSSVSSTTSSKTRKKKDVESGIGSVSHQRRNLIIISLFLLILLILISAVVIFLLGQGWGQN